MDITKRLRNLHQARGYRPGRGTTIFAEAADAIDELRSATGNLPPALVAKALAALLRIQLWEWHTDVMFTDDEIDQLRQASFEVRQ